MVQRWSICASHARIVAITRITQQRRGDKARHRHLRRVLDCNAQRADIDDE
jgi:hypothetical protein